MEIRAAKSMIAVPLGTCALRQRVMAMVDGEVEERAVPASGLEALRLDYVGKVMSCKAICAKHEISRRRLYILIKENGWPLRSPNRVDKHHLAQRLLRLLQRQIDNVEKAMEKGETDETEVLSKLASTLDRLISIKNREAKQRPAKQSSSTAMTEIRQKVAERLAELNGN